MTSDDALQGLLLTDAVAVHLGLASMIGALAACTWLRQAEGTWAGMARERTRVSLRIGLLATAIASTLGLWLQACAMAEIPLLDAGAWSAVVSVLADTHFGHAWLAGMVALLAIGAVNATREFIGRGRGTFAVMVVALSVFAYTRSIVSHAGAQGDAIWPVAVDWLHLVLVCFWVGIVFQAVVSALPQPAPSLHDRHERAAWIASLSGAATAALVAIVLTGVVNFWRGAGPLDRIIGTTYFTVLVVKLAGVTVAAALGGLNRFVVLPRLARDLAFGSQAPGEDIGLLVRVLRVELAVLVSVLVAAALLGLTAPPATLE